jgi:hypothetical protein
MNVPEPIVVHVDEAPRPRWAWCRHNGYALGRTRVAGTRAGHGLFIGRRSGRRRNCTPFQFELIHSRATAIREQHVDEQVEVPTHPSSRSCHRARASKRALLSRRVSDPRNSRAQGPEVRTGRWSYYCRTCPNCRLHARQCSPFCRGPGYPGCFPHVCHRRLFGM